MDSRVKRSLGFVKRDTDLKTDFFFMFAFHWVESGGHLFFLEFKPKRANPAWAIFCRFFSEFGVSTTGASGEDSFQFRISSSRQSPLFPLPWIGKTKEERPWRAALTRRRTVRTERFGDFGDVDVCHGHEKLKFWGFRPLRLIKSLRELFHRVIRIARDSGHGQTPQPIHDWCTNDGRSVLFEVWLHWLLSNTKQGAYSRKVGLERVSLLFQWTIICRDREMSWPK